MPQLSADCSFNMYLFEVSCWFVGDQASSCGKYSALSNFPRQLALLEVSVRRLQKGSFPTTLVLLDGKICYPEQLESIVFPQSQPRSPEPKSLN